MTNPFLRPWTTAFDLPPFDDITDDHFRPAFDAGIDQGRAAITAIAENPEPPTFENTIEAMETAEDLLSKVLGVFYGIAGADSNDAREALQRDFGPILSDYSSEITANAALFARIETLWNKRDELGLTDEQMRVLMLTRRSFVRSGALLSDDDKARMAKVKSRLSSLGTEFSQNLLSDESDWFLELTEDDLEGLPDFVCDAMRSAGASKKLNGPCLTTSRSLFVPFLQFSPRRDLREAVFKAWKSRGSRGGKTDNRANAAEILKLREERAKLLGYESFATYKLETQMAKTPDAVRDLLMEVWSPAKQAAERDADILEKMLVADGFAAPLEPWDWRYYSEKRRKIEHDLDEAELKPYLQLDRMIEAAFSCATRLFNLQFEPLKETLYHEDVRGWNVTRDGEHLAVFIGDYFARSSKRSGAWCTAMRSQKKLGGDTKPIVLNVCNFAKASGDKPNLLSYDDARTLFHEFGHALHQMLSNVTFESISGTSVARDFVELPSQLYEHWLEVPEVLEEFATHADTGAPMPADMLQRLLNAQTYDQGYTTVGYVASALTDLNFHDGDAPSDPMQSQAQTLDQLGMPHATTMFHEAPHFQHVFAGDGYSCGYYSYMWSEVMDADAFDAFKEAGAFDAETAKRLETHILSTGGSADAEALYTAFRGRMPGPEAMLKGRGLA
ncbi:peptidyl-dipeptidase Dcp [Pacificibacter maritimus]|uniref:Peptidyl-dipeptidase Dcp n=1 Tax=Pacificibacter maritimus TaxID=762213 RepID=A0A3N4V075_9RHOB|nr:M3 family metallopeptidase [Pacificibacter maritimus]RPE67260.1 peptidyl-dipeptidase Dcp [Pacificibacter maritimus]